eukprot:CAMPEP_0177573948 /NCGR_PEP_ID=MMETSP0369-20130122/78795_1 /TAXON_ID=447022 ORGANISM="Scrippsiella hangoei-like, Strain SHHI-4" /NCGR_SAMPLE_ID=MMETSP0369 /ASSEMBLY_ACC=CAM_ASM_000364 /LENGTH=261 /DNA_ID=CAMNT_0019062085 /DNA_START=113 /DNA_END=895 /DNA_ORIENTATION=+
MLLRGEFPRVLVGLVEHRLNGVLCGLPTKIDKRFIQGCRERTSANVRCLLIVLGRGELVDVVVVLVAVDVTDGARVAAVADHEDSDTLRNERVNCSRELVIDEHRLLRQLSSSARSDKGLVEAGHLIAIGVRDVDAVAGEEEDKPIAGLTTPGCHGEVIHQDASRWEVESTNAVLVRIQRHVGNASTTRDCAHRLRIHVARELRSRTVLVVQGNDNNMDLAAGALPSLDLLRLDTAATAHDFQRARASLSTWTRAERCSQL